MHPLTGIVKKAIAQKGPDLAEIRKYFWDKKFFDKEGVVKPVVDLEKAIKILSPKDVVVLVLRNKATVDIEDYVKQFKDIFKEQFPDIQLTFADAGRDRMGEILVDWDKAEISRTKCFICDLGLVIKEDGKVITYRAPKIPMLTEFQFYKEPEKEQEETK